jgi:CheY-like chemotaxis protein
MINLSGKHILVVEDDDMNFIYLKQIIMLVKGDITRVKTGKAAIEACKEKSFDFVLMDIQLPDISGITTTKTIRKFNPTIPIIAQTACRTPDELETVLAAGCNDILIKPFKMEDFNSKIEKHIL